MKSFRILSTLLCYPDAELRAALPEIVAALREERALPASRLAAIEALAQRLANGDPYEVESRYVQLFDRGRSTSLHLFEHVHGDSRDRGQAMVDLLQTYEHSGLVLGANELPDFLPVALEFASTQADRVARAFVAEFAHILNTIHTALIERSSAYAQVIAAVIELSGEAVDLAVKADADEPIDEAWEEPPAFGGCSTRGQSAQGGTVQPIQFFPNHSTRGAQK
ncbi:MAG: nitrate reductase molybdenum cofactor assembly chaperone [Burkholderiaceae bacterium]|nr:nitrate reductase molybdenum cofactor assembly chaperone [Burkholderiaceae bacterium]